jgi:hypothetical protein
MRRLTLWTVLPVLMLLASGCTLKGTTNEITDTTSNVTGSTSGRTWFTEDGILHPEHKLIAFTALNQMNVEQDLASSWECRTTSKRPFAPRRRGNSRRSSRPIMMPGSNSSGRWLASN